LGEAKGLAQSCSEASSAMSSAARASTFVRRALGSDFNTSFNVRAIGSTLLVLFQCFHMLIKSVIRSFDQSFVKFLFASA